MRGNVLIFDLCRVSRSRSRKGFEHVLREFVRRFHEGSTSDSDGVCSFGRPLASSWQSCLHAVD